MTREDAYALGNIIHQEVITFYESQLNEIFKKCTIYHPYRSFRGDTNIRSKLINPIYNDHEAQLKAKESDLERQDMIIKCLNIDLDNKEKLLKAKDELIKELEEAMKPKTCEGCKHKPNDGECYYEPCGTCARFFYDHYELKDDE